MKKTVAALASCLMAVGLVSGAAAPAAAHDPHGYGWASSDKVEGTIAGGGKHWYGVHTNINGTNRRNDSSYYHATKKHRASVQNPKYGVTRSADTVKGKWARADQPASPSGNQAYWYAY